MQHYCYLPLTRADESILPPYFSTVVHKTQRQPIDWAASQYLGLSQSPPWLVLRGKGFWPQRTLHSDKANGENAACSARPHLRMVLQLVGAGSK